MSKANIKESLKRLEKISSWFENEKDLDIEEGLKRVKEGVEIIKKLKERIKEAENEFEEIKKEIKRVD